MNRFRALSESIPAEASGSAKESKKVVGDIIWLRAVLPGLIAGSG
jgi:hypothetical protein